ncbi:N/A [soil metagenome]
MNLSVALGTHNGARYIAQQLESILNQTVPPTEIVLSDDASTDDTVALARATVGDRVPLKVILNNPALGVVANFEQAVLACTGELIALSDQDDAWHPEKVERIHRVFDERPGVSLVHTDARLVAGDGHPLGMSLLRSLEARASELREIHEGHAFSTLLRRNLVTGATTVFRASLLTSATPFSTEWVHDEWLAIISAAVATNEVLEEELIDYRQHGGNQIGARRLSFREKLGKFREPRTERNAHLLSRTVELVERLRQVGIDPARLQLAEQKLEFERYRTSLPAPHFLRVFPILRTALAGRYRAFSLGLPDMVRDLAQPAR